jgi:hypothetical protein
MKCINQKEKNNITINSIIKRILKKTIDGI